MKAEIDALEVLSGKIKTNNNCKTTASLVASSIKRWVFADENQWFNAIGRTVSMTNVSHIIQSSEEFYHRPRFVLNVT